MAETVQEIIALAIYDAPDPTSGDAIATALLSSEFIEGDTPAKALRQVREICRSGATSVIAALEAAGFAIAPKEPTAEMRQVAFAAATKVNLGRDQNHIAAVALDSQTVYRAMLEARPK